MATCGSLYLVIFNHVFKGVGGYHGDGDVTKTANIEAFRDYVMKCTDNQGVHFVMADGVSSSTLYFYVVVSYIIHTIY